MQTKDKVKLIVAAALDKKASEPVVFETTALTDVADYVIVVSGSSDRQVRAIADSIDEQLRKAGERPQGIEGEKEGRWILIDSTDVIVHVFYEPVRQYYEIEKLWMDAPRYVPDLPELNAASADRAPEAGLGR